MNQFVFKVFNTVLSLSLLVFIYTVKSGLHIGRIVSHFGISVTMLNDFCPLWSYLAYFCILFLLAFCLSKTFVSLKIKQDIPNGAIQLIEPVGDTFITSYLGYFFIALSIPNLETLVISFLVLGLFVYLSNIFLFNPLYLLLGYKFFYATTKQNKKILILAMEDIQFGDSVHFNSLRKVNEFTYIDA